MRDRYLKIASGAVCVAAALAILFALASPGEVGAMSAAFNGSLGSTSSVRGGSYDGVYPGLDCVIPGPGGWSVPDRQFGLLYIVIYEWQQGYANSYNKKIHTMSLVSWQINCENNGSMDHAHL